MIYVVVSKYHCFIWNVSILWCIFCCCCLLIWVAAITASEHLSVYKIPKTNVRCTSIESKDREKTAASKWSNWVRKRWNPWLYSEFCSYKYWVVNCNSHACAFKIVFQRRAFPLLKIRFYSYLWMDLAHSTCHKMDMTYLVIRHLCNISLVAENFTHKNPLRVHTHITENSFQLIFVGQRNRVWRDRKLKMCSCARDIYLLFTSIIYRRRAKTYIVLAFDTHKVLWNMVVFIVFCSHSKNMCIE